MIHAVNLFIPKDVEDHTDHIITDPVEQYVVSECIEDILVQHLDNLHDWQSM